MPTVIVKSKRVDGRVALFERDPAHPGGQAFVRGDGKPVAVAETRALEDAIRQQRVVVVPQVAPATPQPPDTHKQGGGDKPAPPWAGYDQASAEEIVAKLPDLDDAGRAAVLAYEQARGSRARKTIVAALPVAAASSGEKA